LPASPAATAVALTTVAPPVGRLISEAGRLLPARSAQATTGTTGGGFSGGLPGGSVRHRRSAGGLFGTIGKKPAAAASSPTAAASGQDQ
jgi:hypothetical protein